LLLATSLCHVINTGGNIHFSCSTVLYVFCMSHDYRDTKFGLSQIVSHKNPLEVTSSSWNAGMSYDFAMSGGNHT